MLQVEGPDAQLTAVTVEWLGLGRCVWVEHGSADLSDCQMMGPTGLLVSRLLA